MPTDDFAADPVARSALRKAAWRILPLMALGYGIAYVDRTNISFAALQMNEDLHFSAVVYGFGAGLFFLSYAAFEVPSNLLLVRFGARRWFARIMITWGIISMGMLFVKTPTQFYVMRFLLGLAEAGFFPGALFYLMQWFPAHYRGRALNRFYFAFPLSSVVMGAAAGPLLNLHGSFGLAGWQWLFLVEGLPAVLLGVVVFFYLKDSPAQATWLTPEERTSLQQQIEADRIALGGPQSHNFLRALLDPRVMRLGFCNLCIMFCAYAFIFSAPTMLQGATHWDATKIGLFVAVTAGLGAIVMLVNGWHSDLRRERYWHSALPLLAGSAALVAMGTWNNAWVAIVAYVIIFNAQTGVQSTFWLIPSDVLHGRSAAIGVAAIGSIGMLGGFLGPYAMGLARDYTGSYQAGLVAIAVPYVTAAVILIVMGYASRAHRASAPSAVAPAS